MGKAEEKSIDDLIAKENYCEQELDAALTEYQTLSRNAEVHDPERLKLRKTMSQETEEQLKSYFGRSFSHRWLQSAESDVQLYLEDDEQDLRRYLDRKWQAERMMHRKHGPRRQSKEPER